MLKSMTGYGTASCEFEGVNYTVEIKSVNGRYLKPCVRTPEDLGFLDIEIENLIKKYITRGTVSCSLRYKLASEQASAYVNAAAVEGYLTKLRDAASRVEGIKYRIELAKLLDAPGVTDSEELTEDKAKILLQKISEITVSALENLTAMRIAEGKTVKADIISRCGEISDITKRLYERAPKVIDEYHTRLEKRVNEMIKGAKLELDQQTLVREIAVFADRADISEEISRLESHIEQIKETCSEDEPGGRKLDFICQELFRESNTIGSKSNDPEISKCSVELKCIVEKIKEQVQNVE
ncbi:hypothetical protein SMSP2_00495 [Limihaloglobus sulfuriphilus]|uniref:YicC-like family, N-terminal region n=1 Tax=Limihaloglobus sulfuriphilus TaxID=1851148 RepID=A0A1Q2MBQ5_9BACT|nr:YicC/YloC family endoribonuclease [Limihaloglobus sulfuriphilus]AQQ70153.1 hypothetical protein SMSP2_00495 [Limihaloglobus sulfuriphilus]